MENLGRLTPATALVLEALLSADSVWGLHIIRSSGKKPGTIYPILDRLENAGWVVSEWDMTQARRGPRRRYYRLLAEARPLAQKYVKAQREKLTPITRPSPVTAEARWLPA
ncbi:helix-turn-helix transcriptional regulator [Pseudarthrobacter chlorophenolicus]|uniref:helix-turn-helix transcriptional regulator n=1 Tax=Pseudarthrobacter chlorophenolicus TaxID=85085 RepID=UPI0009E566AF|nr:PadR family transcriptional regulator [Pseudarthrobacter chlorophenolicus]